MNTMKNLCFLIIFFCNIGYIYAQSLTNSSSDKNKNLEIIFPQHSIKTNFLVDSTGCNISNLIDKLETGITPLYDLISLESNLGSAIALKQNSSRPAIDIFTTDSNAYFIRARKTLGFGFNGQDLSRITFSVKSDGTIYSANSQLTLSDETHKQNIATVSGVLASLREVNPVSYTLNIGGNEDLEQTTTRMTTSTSVLSDNNEITPAVQALIDAESNRPKYGFVAQDIAQIFPNVVYTLPSGEKAIAYQELIPVLVSAIQELDAANDSLIARIEKLENDSDIPRNQAPAALQEAVISGDVALLQNTPNPFDNSTVIAYRLPEGTATAMIIICDMTGKLLQSYPLPIQKNDGSISVQAGSFAPGIYLYSLLVDGVQVDTRQMIINK